MSDRSHHDSAARRATNRSPSVRPSQGPQHGTIGRYHLVAQLASGGMATVYLATMQGPGGFEKVVALKRIHPHLAEEGDFVDMFLDEARIAARIHHANVCQVFDFGDADGSYYIAMEYLLGESLSRIMKTVRKDPDVFDSPRHQMLAVKVIADACEGLHAAHELRGRDGDQLNVVHRDVSPQNLFVTYDGNVKIVDFGIASAADRVHHTSAGQVKGKFSYMAPEQSRGIEIDRRADVWALGVVLWEMLTLRRLFRRETTVETLTAMLNEAIPPPSVYRPTIPPELDAIVLKALERDRDRRYMSAREFGRDLVRFAGQTGEPSGMADLADWMDQLFPDGRERGRERLDAVARGEVIDSTVVTPMHMEVSESEVQYVDAADVVGLDAIPDQRAAPAGPPALATGAHPSQTESSSGRLVVLAILGTISLLSILGIVGILAWMNAGTGTVEAEDDIGEAAEPNPPIATGPAEPEGPIEPQTPPDPEEAAPPEEQDPEETEPATAMNDTRQAMSLAERRRLERLRRERDDAMMVVAEVMEPVMQEEEEPPPMVATGTGSVFVTTPGGWANVYTATGRFLGQTPRRVELPAGTHRLQLRPFGQPPARTIRVTVVAGETRPVSMPLSGE